jgi:DNA-binding MarR family transcriptional regulator
MAPRHHHPPDRALTARSALSTIEFAGLDELLGYGLRRAQGAVHRDYMAAIAELKITQKQAAVMWLVQGNPGVVQGAIGTTLGMDRATMMALVNRLEARGLLTRRRSRTDARQRELHLTATGTLLIDQVRERILRHERRMQRLFSEAQLRGLKRLLRRLQSLAP